MRIDLGARLGGADDAGGEVGRKAANPAASQAASRDVNPAAGQGLGQVSRQEPDTARFLLDRVQSQALAQDPAQIEAGQLRVEALRKVLQAGSYSVPPESIAGAIVAEARV